MADTLFSIADRQLTPKHIVISLIVNAILNTIIAFFLNAIGFGTGFVKTIIFSQCIGMSIYLANLVAFRLFRNVIGAAYQVVIIFAAVMLGAFAGTLLGALANGYDPLLFIGEHSTFFAQIVLIALLFGSIISYVFISLAKLSEEKIKRLDMRKNAAEAELKLLQSQMEPHFLFNTLSNVTSLMDSDRGKAKHMLESFTAFLRGSFMTARQRTVTLDQEMDVVKNYLEVYSVRMGNRLAYTMDIPDSLRPVMIPPLLIQPLVENAVKHGLEPAIAGGEIIIRAVREGDSVRITVADSGTGIDVKGTGNNIGLDNIKKRLELMYGDRGSLFLEENKPRGVKVVVEIPYETGTSNHR